MFRLGDPTHEISWDAYERVRHKHIDAAVVNDQGQQAQRLEAGKAVIRWKAS